MFSNHLSYNNLHKILKYDRIYAQRFLSLLKIIPELDEKVNKKILNNEMKERQHPGIIKNNCVSLPNSISKAITDIIGTCRTELAREYESFARYLHGRQLPVEKNLLNSKISSVKQDVEDLMDINKDELSEEEIEYYNKFVQFNTNQILKQKLYHWQPIIFTRKTGLIYLFTRAAAEYAVITQIFKEIKLRENFSPQTLFDFGSGVGTVTWAANEIWGNSLKEFFSVDPSINMINISEELIDSYDKELKKKMFYRQFLPINPSYDIVVSAYSLLELPSAASRLETLAKLWNKTTRYLVLIEQGTAAGFKIISEARKFILDASKDETTKIKAHIFSPCPHDLDCPKIAGEEVRSPCHFQVSYYNYFKKEQIRKECYSYVVIKKGLRKPCDDDHWPRIVRPVLCRSKHVICRLCTNSGALQEVIFTPTKHGRIQYRCAKKSRWGDRLPISLRYIQ